MSMKWRNPDKLKHKGHGRHDEVQRPHENKYKADSGPGSSWDKMQKAKHRAWEREAGMHQPNDSIELSGNCYVYRDMSFLMDSADSTVGLTRQEIPRVAPSVVQAIEYQKSDCSGQGVHVLVNNGAAEFYVEVSHGGVVRLPRLKWDNLGRGSVEKSAAMYGRTKDMSQILSFNPFNPETMRKPARRPWETGYR